MSTVVLVSGGAAVTPFTTPDRAATRGLAAGNSLTALRDGLLAAGHRVFTAPASLGGTPVADDTGWQGFSGVPEVLPAEMTVDATGEIDHAGVALHAFLQHLATDYQVRDVALVAHSMGGLFARAAIHHGRRDLPAVDIRHLITIGTPWTGALLGDAVAGDLAARDAHGDPFTMQVLARSITYARDNSHGAAEQVAARYLAGPDGWNARHEGDLSGIPVTVIAGDALAAHDAPTSLWPHDGLVSHRSASAADVPLSVLPDVARHTVDDVHSIFFADALGLPWERALTWDPAVLAEVDRVLAR